MSQSSNTKKYHFINNRNIQTRNQPNKTGDEAYTNENQVIHFRCKRFHKTLIYTVHPLQRKRCKRVTRSASSERDSHVESPVHIKSARYVPSASHHTSGRRPNCRCSWPGTLINDNTSGHSVPFERQTCPATPGTCFSPQSSKWPLGSQPYYHSHA